jgi:hypothetical protein
LRPGKCRKTKPNEKKRISHESPTHLGSGYHKSLEKKLKLGDIAHQEIYALEKLTLHAGAEKLNVTLFK